MKRYALTALLLTALFSCKNDKPAPQPGESPNTQKELYITTVDNLRLLAEPSSESKTLTKVHAGSIVESLGEVSPVKEEQELRGRLWLEPYYLMMAPNKQRGWLYGGGLLRLHSSTNDTLPDIELVEDFARKIYSMDPSSLQSGQDAIALAQKTFDKAHTATSDAGAILLEYYLKRMLFEGELYRFTEGPEWNNANYIEAIRANSFDMNTFTETQKLADGGFMLATAEGLVYPEINYKKLLEIFKGQLSPPLNAFFEKMAEETEKPVWEDGGLVLPLKAIVDRAAWWENFNRDHPDFAMRETVRFNAFYLIHSITHGGDNTPNYDMETEEIRPEFREVWAYIQEQYPDTKLAQYSKRMYDVSAANNWKLTPAVEAEMSQITRELLPD